MYVAPSTIVNKSSIYIYNNSVSLVVLHVSHLSLFQVGWNPVHWAASEGHLKIIQFLEEKGINLKETTNVSSYKLI